MSYLWKNHTKDEIGCKIKSGWTTAILPIGAVEQHGPHLAVGYDCFIATRIAHDIASELPAFVLPEMPYGASSHHVGFDGTISLTENTIIQVLSEIAQSLHACGIRRLVLINGHGGNYLLIGRFASSCNLQGFQVVHDSSEKFIFQAIKDFSKEFSEGHLGLHAGQFETSLAMYTHPMMVRMDKLSPGLVPPSEGWSHATIQRILNEGLICSTKNGVIGDPVSSTAAAGERFYRRLLKYYKGLCGISQND